MSNDYQPKIDKWWAGLTPEERGQWWSEGDIAIYWCIPYLVIRVAGYYKGESLKKGLWLDFHNGCAPAIHCTPAPCAQLWWKLAWQYLGVQRFLSALYDAGLIKTRSHEYDRGWGSITSFKDDDEERIKSIIIDACLAVQRGEQS